MNEATTRQVNQLLEDAEKTPDEEKLITVNGLVYPSNMVEERTLQALPAFRARPEDILLLSYPKCGCNWTLRLLMQMVNVAHPELKEAPSAHQQHIPILEFGPPSKLEAMSGFPSPRIIGSHMPRLLVPSSFFLNKCKTLIIFRDPKDTAVSFFNFFKNNPGLPTIESWDKFYRMFMDGDVPWGLYSDYMKQWGHHWEDGNILLLTYEELKADLRGQVQRMSTFLGLGLSEEQITAVAAGGTFSAMKATAEANNFKFGKAVFRKGEVGDWKNYFSEEQRAELEATYAQALAGTSLSARLCYSTAGE